MYWNIIIGNLLQDIMTYQKMQKLVVKLEEMYDRDSADRHVQPTRI